MAPYFEPRGGNQRDWLTEGEIRNLSSQLIDDKMRPLADEVKTLCTRTTTMERRSEQAFGAVDNSKDNGWVGREFEKLTGLIADLSQQFTQNATNQMSRELERDRLWERRHEQTTKQNNAAHLAAADASMRADETRRMVERMGPLTVAIQRNSSVIAESAPRILESAQEVRNISDVVVPPMMEFINNEEVREAVRTAAGETVSRVKKYALWRSLGWMITASLVLGHWAWSAWLHDHPRNPRVVPVIIHDPAPTTDGSSVPNIPTSPIRALPPNSMPKQTPASDDHSAGK